MSMNNTLDKAQKIKPTVRFMLSHPSHFIAQGFGTGLSPVMPGTVGTLFAWLCFVTFNARWPMFFTETVWAVIIVTMFILGVVVCHQTGQDLASPDDGSMVWDEIVATWMVLWMLSPASLATQCWAVFWFRVFDMVKPPPIRYIDQHMKGGLGVMWDDVMAAFYTLLLFAFWRTFFII